jgi:L-ascorbate metabolism protein UlaG (beta-lactamase superfamily)
LLAANPSLTVVVPEANRVFAAERLGLVPEQLFGINAGDRKPCGPFAIEALPSAHEAIETDPLGRQRYLGYVAALGPWRVYHSGDTVLYDGLAGRLRQLAVDIALLPINGRAPERRVAGNLTGPEAAQLAKDAGIRWVVPCHYEMFGFNTASPDAFTAACERLRQPYRLLRAGERWSIAAPSPLASES